MADLQYAFMRADLTGAGVDTLPVPHFDDDPDNCLIKTLTDCSASKQTDPAPDFTEEGRGIAVLYANGGDLLLTVGDAPAEPAAGGDGVLRLPQGSSWSVYLTVGKRIRAKDG